MGHVMGSQIADSYVHGELVVHMILLIKMSVLP